MTTCQMCLQSHDLLFLSTQLLLKVKSEFGSLLGRQPAQLDGLFFEILTHKDNSFKNETKYCMFSFACNTNALFAGGVGTTERSKPGSWRTASSCCTSTSCTIFLSLDELLWERHHSAICAETLEAVAALNFLLSFKIFWKISVLVSFDKRQICYLSLNMVIVVNVT